MDLEALLQEMAAQSDQDFCPAKDIRAFEQIRNKANRDIPAHALMRIWRELRSLRITRAGPCAVSVFAPDDRQGYWDDARDYFGTCVSLLARQTPNLALHELFEKEASYAVLPWPEDGDPNPWWNYLVRETPETPKVLARIPLISAPNARRPDRPGLIVGRDNFKDAGAGETLIVCETPYAVSRARILDSGRDSGIEILTIASSPSQDPGQAANISALHVVSVSGFWSAGAKALKQMRNKLAQDGREARLTIVGGYPVLATEPSDLAGK